MSALAAALAFTRLPITLEGMTLAQIEEAAIRASFARHNGHRRRMMIELGIGKTTLLRKLVRLGLRSRRTWEPYR